MNVSGPVKASTSVTTSLSASDFEAAKRAFAKFDKNGTLFTALISMRLPCHQPGKDTDSA